MYRIKFTLILIFFRPQKGLTFQNLTVKKHYAMSSTQSQVKRSIKRQKYRRPTHNGWLTCDWLAFFLLLPLQLISHLHLCLFLTFLQFFLSSGSFHHHQCIHHDLYSHLLHPVKAKSESFPGIVSPFTSRDYLRCLLGSRPALCSSEPVRAWRLFSHWDNPCILL